LITQNDANKTTFSCILHDDLIQIRKRIKWWYETHQYRWKKRKIEQQRYFLA